MIVCLCEGVSHRRIDEAISEGARTLGDVGRACGAGTSCGMCRCDIRERLAAAKRREGDRSEAPLAA